MNITQKFDRASGVLLVRWHNNKVVNTIANYDVANPPTSTIRYDRTGKNLLPIPQPKVLRRFTTQEWAESTCVTSYWARMK